MYFIMYITPLKWEIFSYMQTHELGDCFILCASSFCTKSTQFGNFSLSHTHSIFHLIYVKLNRLLAHTFFHLNDQVCMKWNLFKFISITHKILNPQSYFIKMNTLRCRNKNSYRFIACLTMFIKNAWSSFCEERVQIFLIFIR